MNTRKISRISARFFATGMVIATMLLLASISPALGQGRSESRDNPKLLELQKDGKLEVVEDDLDGSNDEYFYKFFAATGKVTITFEVKASDGNAGATFDLFDAKTSRPILSNVLVQGVDSGSERVVRSVKSGRRRGIILRIKGIRYGDSGGNGTYKVVVSGNLSEGIG